MAYLPPEKRKHPPAGAPGAPHTPRVHPLAMVGFIALVIVAIPLIAYGIFLAAALILQPDWN